jgi:uncharacterized protein
MEGGFTSIGQVHPEGGPLVILYTIDLPDAESRIVSAGGKVVKPAYAFPGGRRLHFADLDGYELAVWSEH